MAADNVFRFLTVRPANLRGGQAAIQYRAPLYDAGGESPFFQSIEAARKRNANREEIITLAKGVRNTPDYITATSQLSLDVGPLLRWMEATRNTPLKDIDFASTVETLYGRSLSRVVGSQEFRKSCTLLADTILSDTITGHAAARRDRLVVAFKLLNLLKRAKGGEPAPAGQKNLGRVIGDAVVVLPDASNLAGVPSGGVTRPPIADDPPSDKRARERERLLARRRDLEGARREMARLASDEGSVVVKTERQEAPVEGVVQHPGHVFVLSPDAVHGLGDATRRVLDDLRLGVDKVNPMAAMDRIEEEIIHVNAMLPPRPAAGKFIVLGGVRLDEVRFMHAIGWRDGEVLGDALGPGVLPEGPGIELLPGCVRAGIGDLLILKQTLKAYELAEFAHVENVLSGETRERTHRRLNVREEITVLETERETEEERDLQSTSRDELQNEAEKTVKNQLELEAGLQVSGSYGPSLSFSASLNAGFSTTTEEAQRKATSYSREVVEKSAERIRERVREERRRRVLEEIEETNFHKVENTNPARGHVRGIYRWLNKIYDAQVLNYGQRMMFEFIVPEPAAFFLYALVENPPDGLELEKPEAPVFTNDEGDTGPLQPQHLTATNYQEYVSQYHVTGVAPPLPGYVQIAYTDRQDAAQPGHFGRAIKIPIDPGYKAFAALAYLAYRNEPGPTDVALAIGGRQWTSSALNSGHIQWFSLRRRKEVSMVVKLENVSAFAIGVDLFCMLAEEQLAKWQQDTYDAIITAYLQLKTDYDEKLAAIGFQQGGVGILGRNPLENRRLEREELKKSALVLLTRFTNIGFDSFYEDSEPVINIRKACAAGDYIRFCEQAFEWNNMLYVFYPYFWGRHARWTTALHLTDPDLDFAAFLKAGAARVQVPVRPGFERAVTYFCQTGQIPEGNDIALYDDDLYVPIVDEIIENLGRLDDGVPYPEGAEPWEVTLPTSLVVVQNLEEVPNIRDTLTGNDISLSNAEPD